MLLLLTSIWLVAGQVVPVRAGEVPDGAHTGVLIEPLPDAAEARGGAGGTHGNDAAGARAPEAHAPPAAAVGPAVLDSWNSRAGGDQEGAAMRRGPVGRSDAQAGVRQDARDDAVRALYDMAREALENGRAEEAQSLLERLVVEAPQSSLAKQARRQLGAIYSGAVGPAATTDMSAKAAPAAHAPASASAPETAGVQALSPPPLPHDQSANVDGAPATAGSVTAALPSVTAQAKWRERARPTPRFEEMMRAAVGDRIFFSIGSADLGGRARAVLERQAEWVSKFPDLYVVVEGHADEPGGDDINVAMGLRRADLVRARLIAAGVPAARIDVESRGAKDRAVICEGANCRSQNSKVVTRLMVVLPLTVGNRALQAGDTSEPPKMANGMQRRPPGAEPVPRR